MGGILAHIDDILLGPVGIGLHARCEVLCERLGAAWLAEAAPVGGPIAERLRATGSEGSSAAFPPNASGTRAALELVIADAPRLPPETQMVHHLWRMAAPERIEVPVPAGLDELCGWLRWELEYARRPALLVIGTGLGALVAHPLYPCGNIRLAKVLGTLLLVRSGYRAAARVPVDLVLPALATRLEACRSRLAREPGGPALSLWCEAFLELVAAQGERALAELTAGEEVRVEPLPALQELLVDLARREGQVTSRRAQQVAGVSRNTLKDNFRRLCELGRLERHGQRRGCFYVLARGKP